MLESNSTLSLLYIEEQSRILRDAFNKVEKRQLSKTSNFLENLNVTVLQDTASRVVQVTLEGTKAGDPAKHVNQVERVRLAWDGQEWTIDDIRRAPR